MADMPCVSKDSQILECESESNALLKSSVAVQSGRLHSLHLSVGMDDNGKEMIITTEA